ncbi:MAG: hypothetical protein R3C25_13355 [Hyphomonadaceae bacterium]
MFANLIATAGLGFAIAVALEALAVFVEQAGAARSPDEDTPRRGIAALAMLALSALTPGLLLAHGFLSTSAAGQTLRLVAMAAPVAAVIGGSLLGAVCGALARGAAPLMRKLALPAALIAMAATIYATLPSIRALAEAAKHGGVVSPF